jgi:hypothetical protein
MTKELELTPAPAKKPRHVVIAINHLSERRKVLLAKKSSIDEELAGLDAAIIALE